MRKPFQGVWNIIRFNYHFYLLSCGFLLLIFSLTPFLAHNYVYYLKGISFLIIGSISVSLLVSFYVYDLSDLYRLNWLKELKPKTKGRIVNINAGFDETSILLKEKYKDSELIVLDFYNPIEHTEVSIKRARKAYPPFPGTRQVNTTKLPLEDQSVDIVFIILAAHEIRKENERIVFFKEINRILRSEGQIIVTEHLRDLPDFLAYNMGFLHFYSKTTWKNCFRAASLGISREVKITPFISTFILEKHGDLS